MQIFFFDTETTGMSSQDRIIQFGAVYGFYDKNTKKFHKERIINQYINTDFPISEGASAVNGITKEKIAPFKEMNHYIREFLSYIVKADVIVCHNIAFDMRMLNQELLFCGIDQRILSGIKTFDTMKDVVRPLNLSKNPKLMELYNMLFDTNFENAHDAMCDINATIDCFFHLLNMDKIKV